MVLPFKRVDVEATSMYAVYGKLPNRPDFLRVNANHPVVAEIDGLVQRSLERLNEGECWLARYDTGTAVEFQYVSCDARHVFSGVIAPSSDQAGRRYPLIAGVIFPRDDVLTNLHTTPIAHEVFFDGLREQVATARENSVEALSCIQFLESQLQSRDAAVADLELAQRMVDLHMRNTPIKRMRDLLAEENHSGSLEQLLLNLLFYRTFLRRFGNASTNLAFFLPLPAESGEQALIACTWLSLLNAFGQEGSGGWIGNYFVVREKERVVLATCFASENDRIAALMLGKHPDAATLLNLENELDAWKCHRLYAEVSYALDRLLADPSLSLTALCNFLSDAACQLWKGG